MTRQKERPWMAKLVSNTRAFASDESGATAIEYALIAAGIALAIILSVDAIGTTLDKTFSKLESNL